MAEPMTVERDEHSTHSKSQTREAFERWARWKAGARYYGRSFVAVGGAGGLLGRLRAGRGARVCPTCKGTGRMPGHLVGSALEFINVPCPGCGGEKRVEGDLGQVMSVKTIDCVFCQHTDPRSGRTVSTGELPDGRTCHKCKGGKRLVGKLVVDGTGAVVEMKVHPATIKGTRYLGPDTEADPLVTLVDQTVLGWAERNDTYWLARVVLEEYTRNGTQEMKATRLRVSRVWYAKNLIAAHQRMGEVLRAAP